MRHVADRMPDRGKRGKDIAILQMGRDAYRKISEIRNCVTWVTIKPFLHTQVWWWHEAKSPTRHSIRADPDAGLRSVFPRPWPIDARWSNC